MKAIFLAVLLAAPALAQTAPELPRVHASAEDCAIFAVLAKAKLGWSETAAPEGNYLMESTVGHDNMQETYVADCRWKDFGLAEPVNDPKGNAKNYAFGFPIRDPNGTVHITWNRFDFETKDEKPVIHQRAEICVLVAHDGQWQIQSCQPNERFLPAEQ